jgi:hypothetical protein
MRIIGLFFFILSSTTAVSQDLGEYHKEIFSDGKDLLPWLFSRSKK